MEIRIAEKATKELEKIPEPLFSCLRQRIENLAKNPLPPDAKRLVNWPGFRIRVGNYRVLYEVRQNEKQIIIYRIRHRSDVYR